MLIGDSNEQKIWKFFKLKGLNDYACAGILGNANAESGLRPNNLQDTYQRKLNMTDEEYTKAVDNGTYNNFVYDAAGYGIFQFTYWTLKKGLLEYARATNRSIGNLEMQLEYSWLTFEKSYSSMLNTLKTATSVLEASNAVLLKFECPADQSVSMQNKRVAYSQSYYNKYATKGNMESESIMGYKTCTKGKAVKLSNNFNSTEFDCHGSGCCSTTLINEKLVEYLQKIREHFGKPITITSGYRCVKHNSSPTVGGATGSRHTKGDAADIVVSGVRPVDVAKYAESIGIKGIGLYSNFVHIDTRTTKSFWYGHEQAYRSTFGGSSISNSTAQTSTNVVTPNTSNETVYTVKSGDSLFTIATKYGTTYKVLAKYNNISNPSIISVGQKIKIPNATSGANKIKVTANLLNVRAGAGTNYKVVTTIKRDSTHKLLEEKNGWGRISSGWIKSDYYKKI